MARWYGFNPPFVGGTQGVLSRQEDIRLIKNDLLQLIMTIPTERIHRPKFGTEVRAALFEPFEESYLELIQSSIQTAIEDNEPRVLRPQVFLEANKDKALLSITVVAQLTFDPAVQLKLETALPLSGAE